MADLFRGFLIFPDFESHARPQEAKTGKKVIATRGRLTTRGQAWPSLATRGRVCFLRPHVDAAPGARARGGEALHVGAGHHVPQVFHRVGNRRVERHLLRIM